MSDPLAAALSDHIWYTTKVVAGKKPFVECKCRRRLEDSDAHASHVAREARNFLAKA